MSVNKSQGRKEKKKKKKKYMAKCSVCREKHAYFARAGAEKPLRCGGCRVPGDVDVVSKKCGCGKRLSFGPVGGKAVHCAECRVEGDVDLNNKMCSTCGEKRPAFAPAGAKRALRCGGCRVPGDVNERSKKCGCGKHPAFGPPGGKKVHCAGCRVEGDVNLKHKMCTTCGEKHPAFAPPGAKRALRCGGCRVAGDVDMVSKKCGCGKLPSFGPRGGKRVHCAECRVEGDVDLRSKMCSTCDEVRPSFAPPGQRATRCAGCHIRGDVNVVSRMCSGCPKYAIFGPAGGRGAATAGSRATSTFSVTSAPPVSLCLHPTAQLRKAPGDALDASCRAISQNIRRSVAPASRTSPSSARPPGKSRPPARNAEPLASSTAIPIGCGTCS
jgi:hypothetical protein